MHFILDRLSKNREEEERGREWATLGVHPLSWLLSNNRLEKMPFVSVPHTSSNRLLLSNQDKGCTPSVAHSLALPLGPALLNLWTVSNHLKFQQSIYRSAFALNIWWDKQNELLVRQPQIWVFYLNIKGKSVLLFCWRPIRLDYL